MKTKASIPLCDGLMSQLENRSVGAHNQRIIYDFKDRGRLDQHGSFVIMYFYKLKEIHYGINIQKSYAIRWTAGMKKQLESDGI